MQQQLLVELKNTSGNPPQVPRSVSRTLNIEETLSVSHIVLANNNSDEDLLSGKSEQVKIPAGLIWIKIIVCS